MTTPMRVALLSVAVGALFILVAFGSAWVPGGAPRWGVWCMIAGSALVMSAMMALGALRSGIRKHRAVLLATFLLVVIVVGFGVPLVLPVATADSPLFLGLPLGVAIEIVGVGLLPVLVLPVLFAAEFRAGGLDAAALAELRRQAAEVRRNQSLSGDA